MISVFLNLLIFFFNLPYDVSMCSWVQCVLLLLDEMIYRSVWSKMQFKSSISLLTFCLDDLWFLKVHYLKSPTIIVSWSIYLFRSVSIFLTLLVSVTLSVSVTWVYISDCHIFLMNWILCVINFLISC